jgi:membrane protease subunit HflK
MRRVLLIVLGVLFVAWLLTGVVEVRPGERAVVRRFGAFLDVKPAPGLWIGWPWGIDQVDRVPADRIQTLAVGYDPELDSEEAQEAAVRRGESPNPPGQLLTGDHNLVDIRVVVSFKVPEEGLESYVLAKDRVEPILGRATETCLAEWVAGRRVDDVLLEGKEQLKVALVRDLKAKLAPYDLGIRVEGVRVVHLAPPEQVKRAFDDVSRAQANIRTQETRARQEQFARLEAARAESRRIEQGAEGYAYTQQELARRNAQRFADRVAVLVEATTKNPKYLQQLWAEERAKVLKRLQETGQLGLIDSLLPGAGKMDGPLGP